MRRVRYGIHNVREGKIYIKVCGLKEYRKKCLGRNTYNRCVWIERILERMCGIKENRIVFGGYKNWMNRRGP
jgi:hypothetical protein